jgi:FtsZ-binding cell division protein ZapB
MSAVKPAKTPLKASKITKETPKSQQLQSFVASLGLTDKVELYLCGELVYIRIDTLLTILSVDVKWFLKNAETPLHYIVINKNVHVNRYGMTKLIGQSKQPTALRLQDYLYDLFYHVETDGVVYRDELKSRDELLELTDKLHVYKSIVDASQIAAEEAKENNNVLRCDYAVLEQDNAKLTQQIALLEDEISEYQEGLESYRAIATKLARYVRIKSTKPPEEAFSDLVDIEEEDESAPDPKIDSDATEARDHHAILSKTVKKIMTKRHVKAGLPTTLPVPPSLKDKQKTIMYYLMRSIEPVDELKYKWSLTDITPDSEHLKRSEEYLEREDGYFPFELVCYRSMQLSNEKKRIIVLFLSLNDGEYEEITINKLIEN